MRSILILGVVVFVQLVILTQIINPTKNFMYLIVSIYSKFNNRKDEIIGNSAFL